MQSRQVRLCLVGFGKVGRAFSELIIHEHDRLQSEVGLDLVVTGICTARFGAVSNPMGVDLHRALERANSNLPQGPFEDSATFASNCPADVVVETTPLEPFTGAVGIKIIRAALSEGRSVVSANKGPVAHGLRELRELADRHGQQYRYESAVADGMPVFSLIERILPCASVTAVAGLLNSTSGVVLDALSHGQRMSEAVRQAQEIGIVEDDPTYDLDGWDAAVKLCAISAAIWDTPLRVEDVEREPISEALSATAVNVGERGHRLVSMASLQLMPSNQGARAMVEIQEIGPESPFFPLTGTSLGIRIESRLLRPVTISCSEPRLADTAYGLLADVLHIELDGNLRVKL